MRRPSISIYKESIMCFGNGMDVLDMVITKTNLLKQLMNAITDDEWIELAQSRDLPISAFNRSVLLEMKTADANDGANAIQEAEVTGLHQVLKDYLEKHLCDKPDGWKWIIISCIYLTFIAERPMHPIDAMDIKETTVDGERIYECPRKSKDGHTTCHYCVCKQMSNYEIMKRKTRKDFLQYDQEKMIQKFRLRHDPDFIYITFIGRLYRVHRTSGNVEWSDDGFAHPHEANYNEAMTIYDVLCYSKEDCQLSWEFVNMKALSSIQSGSATVGGGLFQRTEKYFEQKSGLLSRACEKLGGIKYGKGDVGYQLQLFDFLPVVIQYWEADDEFPTILNLFADKNMLQYMHYETVWFAVGHLMARMREEMESMA